MDALLNKNNSGKEKRKSVKYFNPGNKNSYSDFCNSLSLLLANNNADTRDIVIICIGSDRATGDCLGPLVGNRLIKCGLPVSVYGTLDSPVHARNLSETLDKIHRYHYNPLIIAIDASLGNSRHVGYVTLGKGALKPGTGVEKDLPQVGDICITGIVNVSGMINQMLLQTTRLNLVMQLSDFIYNGLKGMFIY